ncbi:MAG: sodium:solute symporter family protein [Bryobacteraceae bacterium]
MVSVVFVAIYLAAVLYIGIFAFRGSRGSGAEDFFLAGRSLGGFVFLFSLFGTHMTAFAILGSSGHAFHNGIVTYGLMASSSAIVVPLLLLFLGTRLWSIGKHHGFMTPVQIFRDRWECGHIGTVIFVVKAALLVPYIIIGVIGGGTALRAVSGGLVPYWLGGAIVAIVVMSYVFFGGMRGTAWVNTFQTLLFLSFGAIAVLIIGYGMGGFGTAMEKMLASPALAPLLSRERIPPAYFFSYTFIPLSAIAFPHIGIFCLTARTMGQFRRTVLLYPICLLLIWLPCVYLGVAANSADDVPGIQAKIEARERLATDGPALDAATRDQLRARMVSDDVLLLLLGRFAPAWLAGILGAGIMAAVMASDSQILALSTMFTEDIFAYYGHKERFGEAAQVYTGRAFVIALTACAYAVALKFPGNIFELASQYAFSGFAALSPLVAGALLWRGSTKWGALASTLTVAAAVLAMGVFQARVTAPGVYWNVAGIDVIARTPAGTTVFGMLPVVAMTVVSAAMMVAVSLLTPKPSLATIRRYFPAH